MVGSIAQLVERHPVKVMVVGSNPTAPAKRFNVSVLITQSELVCEVRRSKTIGGGFARQKVG